MHLTNRSCKDTNRVYPNEICLNNYVLDHCLHAFEKDPMSYRNEYHRLISNLHKTDGYITNFFQQKLAPFDLSVQQYVALRRLSEVYPDSLAAGELKAKMTDLNSDMTRLVDRLVVKNMLTREIDPQNRRRVMLRLTEESHQFIEKVAIEFNDFESIVSPLTEEEVGLMNTLLDKIRKQQNEGSI